MTEDNKPLVGKIVNWLIDELARAESKHPTWPDDDIHAAAIVGEESGELLQAALQSTYENGSEAAMLKEAIHTGAMSIRFIKNLLNRDRP